MALLLLSLLPTLAAVIGWVAKNRIEEPLDQAVARNLTFSDIQVQARALSQMLFGLLVYDIEVDQQLDPEKRNRIDSLLAQFDALAPTLDAAVEEFREQVPESRITSVSQTSFRDTVNAISSRTNEVTELIDANVRRRQEIGERVVAVSEAAADIESVTLPGDLQGGDVYADVLNIRAGARRLNVLATALANSEAATGVDTASTDFAATLREMVAITATLGDVSIRRDLAKPLSDLFMLGNAMGEDSLFFSVQQTRSLRAELDETLRTVQQLREQLNMQLIVVEEANNTAVRDLVIRADLALSGTRTWLVVTALLSVFVALTFTYFYVYRVLLRRFRRLSNATMRLGRGDLGVEIEHVGEDELSDIANALEVFRDRSRRLLENENALVTRSEELEQVNAELDKFAYVASHDLRAPLRAIENLAGFLHEDIGDSIPADSQKHLNMITQRIQRLDSLLSALLEYSRVGRMQQPIERVELLECVSDCVTMIRDDRFEILVHAAEMTVFTYRTPMELILRNLIDNAQKHHDQDTGTIDVTVTRIDKMLEFEVRDDGPGIPLQFQERVFEMFQTLKPRDDLEGSGMGLAILLKTVDSYGGAISVDSDPDMARGAKFTFTWPVFDAHELPSDTPLT